MLSGVLMGVSEIEYKDSSLLFPKADYGKKNRISELRKLDNE